MLVGVHGFPVVAVADEADLRAEIASLQQQNAELRAQLSNCSEEKMGAQSDVLALIRKLAKQQSDMAAVTLGFKAGPLSIPDALLRSVVPNEYIILLSDAGQTWSKAGLADRFNVDETQILHVYDRALSGFSARLSGSEKSRIEDRSDVFGVAQNGRVFSTGIMGKRRSLPVVEKDVQQVAAKSGVIDVYLFDTGIRRAHLDLQGRVSDVEFSSFDNGIEGEDCAGHGTHVAARIAGRSLGSSHSAQLTSVKVIDRFGTGDVATVIAGIDWVLAQEGEHKLINMSLTRMVTETLNPLDMAVTRLIESGAIVVVAAGNAAADVSGFTPARVSGAITVGSAIGEVLSDFSNAGVGVDIYAPGEAVLSASIRDVCGVQEMSGTSMAAPFVTGVLADLLSKGTAPNELVGALRKQATPYNTGAFAGETERFVLSADEVSGAILCE